MENPEIELEEYRLPWESDDQWDLRKSFLLRHHDKYPSINRLICLSQIFINVEFLGCTYNKKVMEEVLSLAEGLGDDRREERKRVIQKTFVRGGELVQQSNGQANAQRTIRPVNDKPQNPFVPPSSKKPRGGDTDLPDTPKSPLLLKKEGTVVGVRAALAVAADPATRKMARQPLPDSPMELLNQVCNREKVAWKLDFVSREDEMVEYYLCLDDILLTHQFCSSKKEAQSSGSEIAVRRLSSIHLEVREETFFQGITHKLDEQFVKHEVSEFSMEWNPNVELSSACSCALSTLPHALDSSTFGFHFIENSDTSCFTNCSCNLCGIPKERSPWLSTHARTRGRSGSPRKRTCSPSSPTNSGPSERSWTGRIP